MGEVIIGPWVNSVSYSAEPYKEDLLDVLVESLTESLFEWMRDEGFDNLGEMVYTKDLALINESIRSYLMKLQERYHPVQDVSENLFTFKGDMLFIEPGIYVDFKDESDET
jgi:hypothetical protein